MKTTRDRAIDDIPDHQVADRPAIRRLGRLIAEKEAEHRKAVECAQQVSRRIASLEEAAAQRRVEISDIEGNQARIAANALLGDEAAQEAYETNEVTLAASRAFLHQYALARPVLIAHAAAASRPASNIAETIENLQMDLEAVRRREKLKLVEMQA